MSRIHRAEASIQGPTSFSSFSGIWAVPVHSQYIITHAAKRKTRDSQPPKMVSTENEESARSHSRDEREKARTRQSLALHRLRIDSGSDEGFPLPFLGIGQVEAAFLDVAREIRLVPEWISAIDFRNTTDSPGLRRNPLRPLYRSCIPGIGFCTGLLSLSAESDPT